jgi:lysophospholipase
MGTSSSLFNQALLQINNTQMRDIFQSVSTSILENLDETENDIAVYDPNPFYLYNEGQNKNAQEKTLVLVDGGEDLQNIPFYPLLQQKRKVDVIFAIDSSADTMLRWPNGTSMVATFQRNSKSNGIANGTSFPNVPDQNTFINQGLNKRPCFFGCNSSYTTGKVVSSPLIVYIPNSPYTYYSNVSTFDLEYNNTERDSIVLNGYNVATMGNSSADVTWPVCVCCALLSGSFERTNSKVPQKCLDCFQRFCWDGTLNSTTPLSYEPTLSIQANDGTNLRVSFDSKLLISLFLSILLFI